MTDTTPPPPPPSDGVGHPVHLLLAVLGALLRSLVSCASRGCGEPATRPYRVPQSWSP